MLSVNCYKILNTHTEAEGGEKKDDLQMNQISGLVPNSNSEIGKYEKDYKSGVSKDFPHVIASIHNENFDHFIQMISSLI